MTGEGSGGTVITIDGPAASGKSTVAVRLAQELGVAYVSSGLLYRAATLLALEEGVDRQREDALLQLLRAHGITLRATPGANHVTIDGLDVTPKLATATVDEEVSGVARHPRVREWVTERLREVEGSFVIDGRDMGSVVFPDARVKFYLTADPEVRAKRRAGEREGDHKAVAEQLRRRDELDAKQLPPAEDALHMDTSDMSIEQVVAAALGHVRAAGRPTVTAKREAARC